MIILSALTKKYLLDKVANQFFIHTPTNMKTSMYPNNYDDYTRNRFFKIFRILCQHLHDHNSVDKKTEDMVNACLNQKKYKKYISEVEKEEVECMYSNCKIQFIIYPKSDQIVEYNEMLIVDGIALWGNLGGLLGLFVGFSVFGYASTLVDVILEKIKPENTMRVSMFN